MVYPTIPSQQNKQDVTTLLNNIGKRWHLSSFLFGLVVVEEAAAANTGSTSLFYLTDMRTKRHFFLAHFHGTAVFHTSYRIQGMLTKMARCRFSLTATIELPILTDFLITHISQCINTFHNNLVSSKEDLRDTLYKIFFLLSSKISSYQI